MTLVEIGPLMAVSLLCSILYIVEYVYDISGCYGVRYRKSPYRKKEVLVERTTCTKKAHTQPGTFITYTRKGMFELFPNNHLSNECVRT